MKDIIQSNIDALTHELHRANKHQNHREARRLENEITQLRTDPLPRPQEPCTTYQTYTTQPLDLR